MTEKVEVKKGLTLKTIVIGVILVALVTGVTVNFGGQVYDASYTTSLGHITGMTSFEGKGLYFPFWYSFGLFLWVAIVIAVINSFKPIFSKQEVACLAVMVIAAGWICGFRAYDTPFNNILGIAPGAAERGKAWVDARNFWSWLPDILGPKDVDWWRARILPSAAGGSGVVDWAAVMPTIVWFTLFLVGLVGTMGFTVLLLRRVYVDVEALQFPTMDMAGDVVEMTQPGSKAAKFFTNPYFLIGFLVQAIWYLAVTVPYLLPLLRTSSATWDTTVGLIPGTTWFAWPVWKHEWMSTSALPWVYMMVTLVPWQVGWGLMLSTEALIGVVGGWLVFWFLWPLASNAAGLMPTYTPGGFYAWYTLWRPSAVYNTNLITVAVGFIVGLAVIPLFRNRATLIPILKGLWREPAPEVDPARPIPYRMVWVGLIVSVVLTLAMGAVAQVMPLPLLVFLIVMTFITVGYLKIYAETGGVWGVFDTFNYHPMPNDIVIALVMATLFKDVLWSHGAAPTLAMAITVAFILPGLTSGGLYKIFHAGAITSMGSFKLGSKTNTDTKDTAKSVAIALGLGIAVATIMYYVWMHFVGISTKWGYFKGADSAAGWYADYSWKYAQGDQAGIWYGNIANIWGIPATNPTDYVVKFAVGLAVAIIVISMRGRFTWFRISAAGLALGCMFGREIWSPFLVALVIKYLTTRLGGTKLYLEKLRPLSVGLIAGYCAMFAIAHPTLHLFSAFLNR